MESVFFKYTSLFLYTVLEMIIIIFHYIECLFSELQHIIHKYVFHYLRIFNLLSNKENVQLNFKQVFIVIVSYLGKIDFDSIVKLLLKIIFFLLHCSVNEHFRKIYLVFLLQGFTENGLCAKERNS